MRPRSGAFCLRPSPSSLPVHRMAQALGRGGGLLDGTTKTLCGDRQRCPAAGGRLVLAGAGYAVEGPEEIALADYILLPLPLDAAGTPLAELLRADAPGRWRWVGCSRKKQRLLRRRPGWSWWITLPGRSWPSATPSPRRRGASGIGPAQTHPVGSAVLLLGFGPVEAVGTRLAAFGAHVTVDAARPSGHRRKAWGCRGQSWPGWPGWPRPLTRW